jgi:hypothetical protein
LELAGTIASVVAAIFAGLTLFFYFWHRRVRIKYRIRHDLEGRMNKHQVPMIIRITNLTGGTIFRENTYIEFPGAVQMPPQDIVHEPLDAGHPRQMRPGDTVVVTYEMMYLCEQLLTRTQLRGKARVKFVFAEAEKDHTKRITIRPSLEHWARPAIVEDSQRQQNPAG